MTIRERHESFKAFKSKVGSHPRLQRDTEFAALLEIAVNAREDMETLLGLIDQLIVIRFSHPHVQDELVKRVRLVVG